MADHRHEPAAGAQHSADRTERRDQIGDVHEPELTGHAVDHAVVDRRQVGGVVHEVGDRRGRVGALPGQVDHRRCRVDAGDRGRARLGEGSGSQALPAGHVEQVGVSEVGNQAEQAGDRGLVRAAARDQQGVVPGGQRAPRLRLGRGGPGVTHVLRLPAAVDRPADRRCSSTRSGNGRVRSLTTSILQRRPRPGQGRL